MCEITDKIRLFEYILAKLIKLESEQCGKDLEQVTKEYTETRAMKMLYFLCLNSVTIDENGVDTGLFKIFDNYTAHSYGPLEEDILRNSEHFKGFAFDRGYLVRKNVSTDYKLYAETCDENNLEYAFDRIRKMISKPTQDLVNMTRKLFMWNKAKANHGMRLPVNDEQYCKIEKNYYDMLCNG